MTELLHDEERIPDSENSDDSESETETEEEKFSVAVTGADKSQKNGQKVNRNNRKHGKFWKRKSKRVNFNRKGRVLWKINFCENKKNFDLLDPNIPQRKQLNKMWNEMDQVEKLKWMTEAEVKYWKRREDLLKNRAAAAAIPNISRQAEKSEEDGKAKDDKKSQDSEKVLDLKTKEEKLSSAIPGPSGQPVVPKKDKMAELHAEERIPDSENSDDSESETETEEEFSVVVTGTKKSQKNYQHVKRNSKPVNFNNKGKTLWKINFRKHKKNFEFLDPNIPRKKQLNRMWNEMDQVEKLKWMKEAEVKYGKKREDLKNRAAAAALRKISRQAEKSGKDGKGKVNDEKNSPDSEKDVSDLKTEADESSSAIPGPSGQPVFQKKERFFSKRGNPINMKKQGRMLWKDNFRADKKNMELLVRGIKPKDQLHEIWSELDESEKLKWMNRAEIQIRNKQEALKNGLKLPKYNRHKLVVHEERAEQSGSEPSIQDLQITEPLKIDLGDKGKQLWKMHFPNQNLDKRIKRKIQLDSVWSNLSGEEKSAWRAEAEFLLRSRRKKLVKVRLPTPRIPWSNNYFPNLSTGKSLYS